LQNYFVQLCNLWLGLPEIRSNRRKHTKLLTAGKRWTCNLGMRGDERFGISGNFNPPPVSGIAPVLKKSRYNVMDPA
jgi:hypothetical protein